MATGNRLPVESRHQQVINLAIPECYAYIRDAIFEILAEYPISYLKWDHNRDLIDAGSSPSGRPGVHAQTVAFYRLLDEIKSAHPHLEIESCSSGGARVDLGVLERTDRVWVSDCIDPLERQQIQRWTAQLIPLELMGSHIASGHSHTTGRTHSLSFRAATAVFGHLGVEWNLAQATPGELNQLREWIDFFKGERELLLSGEFVRLDFPDDSLCLNGVVAPDRSRAIYSIAPIGRSEVALLGRLRLPGLHRDRRYSVRPLLIGEPPEGLRAPLWWGAQHPAPESYVDPEEQTPLVKPTWAEPPGVVLTGAALASTGLMAPTIHPEQAVLYVAEALA